MASRLDQVGARVDRVLARMAAWRNSPTGNMPRGLMVRWIGVRAGAGQHFLLDTGTLCVIGYYRYIPAVRVWNGPL